MMMRGVGVLKAKDKFGFSCSPFVSLSLSLLFFYILSQSTPFPKEDKKIGGPIQVLSLFLIFIPFSFLSFRFLSWTLNENFFP